MKYSKTTHDFTLIELIIVIGLIGLFLGIAMPAFTNVSKSRSNSAACTDIAGQISIARSYAIQNHCYTALIFPSQDEFETGLGGAPSNNDILANIGKYYEASVRIAIVTPEYNSSGQSTGYRFVMWIPDSQWITFNNGVVLRENEGSKKFPSSHDDDLVDVMVDPDLQKLCGKTPSASRKMNVERFIVIKPNGEIVTNGHDPMIIGVTDGYFDVRKKKIIYEKRKSGGTEAYYHGLYINPLTGRTQQGEYERMEEVKDKN